MKKHLKKTVFIFVLLLMSAMLVLGVSAKYSPTWVVEDMVRTTDEPGIRLSVKIDSALRNDEKLEEYGFIAIASKKLEEGGKSISGFGLDCTLDYMRGVAFGVAEDGSKIDLLRKDDGAKATFSCVIHSIPVEHYKSGIVAKAYLIYDGEVYYSTAFKVNYLGAAQNMKNSEEYESLDENGKKIIDDILLKSGMTDDGEADEILPEPEEPTEYVGIISNYDIGEDADGNWRIFYEVYNPYTSMKEYDIPSMRYSEKAKELSDGLEAGTIVKFDGDSIDDTNADAIKGEISEDNLVWIANVKDDGTLVAAPYDGSYTCQPCIIYNCMHRYIDDGETGVMDIFGNKTNGNFFMLTDDTACATISYSEYSDNMFKWGNMSKITLSDLMTKRNKSLLCYNDKATDSNGSYVTNYSPFMKAFVIVNEENEAELVLVVVNGDENAALWINCERDEGIVSVIPSEWK